MSALLPATACIMIAVGYLVLALHYGNEVRNMRPKHDAAPLVSHGAQKPTLPPPKAKKG
jgi:hypothetical protein